MNYSLSTQHIDLSDNDKKLLDDKMDRIGKLLEPPFVVDVMVRGDRHHRSGNVISCRINIEQSGHLFHAERSESSIQNAIDESLGAIKGELIKFKDKNKHKTE